MFEPLQGQIDFRSLSTFAAYRPSPLIDLRRQIDLCGHINLRGHGDPWGYARFAKRVRMLSAKVSNRYVES